MYVYNVGMYIARVPNRNSPPSYLLRESYRENGKVKNRTLANLSSLPRQQIAMLSRVLRGESLVAADDAFHVTRSLPHGHVQAVLDMIRRLGLETLLASRPCRQRNLVVAMIVQRILHPSSKLAATRLWNTTSLAEELAVADAQVEELYAALDWLLPRQKRIENKLAKRHLGEGVRVLYDVSSSSYFGRTCPLARFGHNRDGRHDLPCIVYGVMTDNDGRPLALDVYPGNTGDPATVPDQIDKLRLRPGLGWLSALRCEAIRKLIDKGRLERSLFDERNLAEIRSPDFPDERLVACFNPILAERRRRKREALLVATEAQFARIAAEVKRRKKKPLSKAEIGLKAGRVLNRHKVGKHFTLSIDNGCFRWQRKQQAIEKEAALDGIYVIRGSETATELSAEDAVRNYKRLGNVEQAFRTLKGVELMVRPIHHHVNDRVRAHLLVCLLAYYVQWHLKQAWAPLLFADEHLAEHRAARDPVAPAQSAAEVQQKSAARRTHEGHEVQSFRTLLMALGTQCRQTYRFAENESAIEIQKLTDPTPLQTEAFRLLQQRV